MHKRLQECISHITCTGHTIALVCFTATGVPHSVPVRVCSTNVSSTTHLTCQSAIQPRASAAVSVRHSATSAVLGYTGENSPGTTRTIFIQSIISGGLHAYLGMCIGEADVRKFVNARSIPEYPLRTYDWVLCFSGVNIRSGHWANGLLANPTSPCCAKSFSTRIKDHHRGICAAYNVVILLHIGQICQAN